MTCTLFPDACRHAGDMVQGFTRYQSTQDAYKIPKASSLNHISMCGTKLEQPS